MPAFSARVDPAGPEALHTSVMDLRSLAGLALGLGLLLATTAARAASDAAHESLALCRQADATPAPARRAVLERGLAAADAAIAADERDAAAHFAAFCNLGKRMRLDGISFASLTSYRRLRREVDRTLELDPDQADALVGKAALLYYSPRLLGGDRREGERLLRHALDVAPDYVDARIALARLLDARGEHDAALAAARTALADATRLALGPQASEAARLIDRLARN